MFGSFVSQLARMSRIHRHDWAYNDEDWVVDGAIPREPWVGGITRRGVETRVCACGVSEYRDRRNVDPAVRRDNWMPCERTVVDGKSELSEPYRPTFAVFGSCPNCGVNWGEKQLRNGSINYKRGHGVMICEDCLGSPAELNPVRIASSLLRSGWAHHDVELVKEAVLPFQAAGTSC